MNLAEERPADVRRLTEAHQSWMRAHPTRSTLPNAVQRRLMGELGYVDLDTGVQPGR